MISDIICSQLFIQSVGVLAMIFSLAVFQTNGRAKMLSLHAVANFLYAVHFFLLAGYTGALIAIAIFIRNVAFYVLGKRQNNFFLPIAFCGVFVAICCFSWGGWASLLPTLGSIFGTLAFWQKNPRLIRLLSLMAPPLWFSYALITNAYPVIITEIIMFSSDLIGICRFDLRKKKKKPTHRKRMHL